MPIYEYRCAGCGAVFARLQSISNPAGDIRCPKCDSDETERILSTFAAGTSTTGTAVDSGQPGCGAGGGG
jgi:putative FmdB family regulatory protein